MIHIPRHWSVIRASSLSHALHLAIPDSLAFFRRSGYRPPPHGSLPARDHGLPPASLLGPAPYSPETSFRWQRVAGHTGALPASAAARVPESAPGADLLEAPAMPHRCCPPATRSRPATGGYEY